jgi:hypothetical protein
LERELGEYSAELRARFTTQDLTRIRGQLSRLPNQEEIGINVERAIARIRPDLAAQRLIEIWNSQGGSTYGQIDENTQRRIISTLERRGMDPDSNEISFNGAATEINMAIRRIQRNFRIESVVNSISQYCLANGIDAPQGNNINQIAIEIANNSRIELEQIREEALRQFRAHFPNRAADAEYNRYQRMGIRVPIVRIEGASQTYDFESGSRMYRENIRPMIEVAREVLTAPKDQVERSNGNITIANEYPLSMTEMFGSEIFEILRRGERLTRGNISAYYNFDINAIVVEVRDHRAVAFFEENGEITQIRAFNNRPMNVRETQNHQRTVDQGSESSRSGSGQMLRDVLSAAYLGEIITDIGLRRIGEWDTIIRGARRN